jgi:hypothetical protein
MMRGSGFARVPSGARRGESGYGVERGIGFGVSGLTGFKVQRLRMNCTVRHQGAGEDGIAEIGATDNSSLE